MKNFQTSFESHYICDVLWNYDRKLVGKSKVKGIQMKYLYLRGKHIKSFKTRTNGDHTKLENIEFINKF